MLLLLAVLVPVVMEAKKTVLRTTGPNDLQPFSVITFVFSVDIGRERLNSVDRNENVTASYLFNYLDTRSCYICLQSDTTVLHSNRNEL